MAVDLEPEVVEVFLVQSALEIGPGVGAGRGVPLEVHVVSSPRSVLPAEEVVEADLVESGRGGECGEMSTDPLLAMIRLDHHYRCIPADEAADSALDVLVTGELGLLLRRDRVDIGSGHGSGNPKMCLVGSLEQLREEESGPYRAELVGHRIEGVDPLPGLHRIVVRQLVQVFVADRVTEVACHAEQVS